MHRDFREAVREGLDKIRLRYLLSQGANLDSCDDSGLTALYYASFRGDVRTVRFLLERGANVNAEDCRFGTPIAVAALRRHPEVVKELLQHKANISRTSSWLGSALHCACFGGDTGIFKAMLLDLGQNYCLEQHHIVHLGMLRAMSAPSLKSSQVGKVTTEEHNGPDRQIKCSPVFLAAECCHFDLLQLCRSRYHYDYLRICTWELAGEDEKFGTKGSSRFRTNTSYSSWRSGPSNASKGSTTSAWSSFGFPLAAREQTRSTLLMWAAAQLNVTLIEHLVTAGASVDTQDIEGRTVLHYAASPSADAVFKDVKQCVKLLIDSAAPMPTIRVGQHFLESVLDLVVSADHVALDPRVSRKWGSDVHRTCISSFLDPLPTDEERAQLAQHALLHALSHQMCPAESIELLCKHARKPGGISRTLVSKDTESNFEQWSMDKALNCALETHASEPIITILLDHGASANNEHNQLPLFAAIASGASAAVVSTLLQHGADPNFRQCSEPNLTAIEYARRKWRSDVIDLFESRPKQSYHTLQCSVEPAAAELSRRGSRDSQRLNLNVMNYVSEMDGLDNLEEVDEPDGSEYDCHDRTDTPEAHNCNEVQVLKRSSRFWLPGMPRFLSDGRQK